MRSGSAGDGPVGRGQRTRSAGQPGPGPGPGRGQRTSFAGQPGPGPGPGRGQLMRQWTWSQQLGPEEPQAEWCKCRSGGSLLGQLVETMTIRRQVQREQGQRTSRWQGQRERGQRMRRRPAQR